MSEGEGVEDRVGVWVRNRITLGFKTDLKHTKVIRVRVRVLVKR